MRFNSLTAESFTKYLSCIWFSLPPLDIALVALVSYYFISEGALDYPRTSLTLLSLSKGICCPFSPSLSLTWTHWSLPCLETLFFTLFIFPFVPLQTVHFKVHDPKMHCKGGSRENTISRYSRRRQVRAAAATLTAVCPLPAWGAGTMRRPLLHRPRHYAHGPPGPPPPAPAGAPASCAASGPAKSGVRHEGTQQDVRHDGVGHRQVQPCDLPRDLHLLPAHVLDHIPALERRRSWGSGLPQPRRLEGSRG